MRASDADYRYRRSETFDVLMLAAVFTGLAINMVLTRADDAGPMPTGIVVLYWLLMAGLAVAAGYATTFAVHRALQVVTVTRSLYGFPLSQREIPFGSMTGVRFAYVPPETHTFSGKRSRRGDYYRVLLLVGGEEPIAVDRFRDREAGLVVADAFTRSTGLPMR